MGSWTLQSATPDIRPRNDVYGHYFAVRFRLKYSPSTFGSFAEMPRLEWKETITMIERSAGTWWRFEGDQYARLPSSQTFNSWVRRYVNAYYSVRNSLYGPDESSRLYDRNGGQLPRDTFAQATDDAARANAVRSYLKSNGGIFEAMVVDKPGINKPALGAMPAVHKNRILTFDCGLTGTAIRVKAYQHLTVDSTKPETGWFRECVLNSTSRPFSTDGLRNVAVPADVARISPFTGSATRGEYQ
jgi:hypothetical protein